MISRSEYEDIYCEPREDFIEDDDFVSYDKVLADV